MFLYLIRHGEVEERYARRYVGAIDAELSGSGRADCAKIGAFLSGISFDRIYSSPLKRAVQSASILFKNAPIVLHPALRETNFGDWEGLTFPEIQARFPESAKICLQTPEKMVFPNGDAVADVRKRVHDFLKELDFRQTNLALVTHGGIIVQILAELLGLEDTQAWRLLPKRGTVLKLEADPQSRLARMIFFGLGEETW